MQLLYTSRTAEQRRQTVLLSKEARERAGEISAWAETATLEEQRLLLRGLWQYRKTGQWRMPVLSEIMELDSLSD
jgi:hypothetical protein